MKFRKLSIRGFKSFMDRFELSFSEGISGIVGPNGSGKSNIVDAIQWCMGEQSPKQLRGRQMEDVIFSGAGSYKPLGMAEVSILLENGTGGFPSPFARDQDLLVTRRLYRSGESEYLLNNTPCRLRDIQEVFMDTGLGNKAYSIISQGRIGSLLEQRPEETRVMLEEAAGITKFRRKVEESGRKIEQTRDNLQRVEDILAEVEKNMRSLKRQAAKARRYKKLSSELRELELTLYANTYHRLETEAGEKHHTTEALLQDREGLEAEIDGIRNRLKALDLDLQRRDAALTELNGRFQRMTDRRNRRKLEMESLHREIQALDEGRQRLTAEQQELEARLKTLDSEKDGVRKKQSGLAGRAEAMQRELSLRKDRLAARKTVLTQAEAAVEAARKSLSAASAQEAGLTHESRVLEKTLQQISDARTRLETERVELQQKADKLAQAAERKQAARAANADRLQDIEERLEAQGEACRELESIFKRRESAYREAEREVQTKESRLGGLENLAESFEGYARGVRTLMKAESRSEMDVRILGLVAEVIQVDPAMEAAVEAALGDALQHVVVASQSDATAAAAYLKSRKSGRSGFLPLADIRFPEPAGWPDREKESEDNGARSLCEHVSAGDAFAPVIRLLLGNTAVVEDLKTAAALWADSRQNRRYVTLEGEILEPNGIIRGGHAGRAGSGLLARRREIRDLRAEISAGRRKLEEAEAELDELRNGMEERRELLTVLSREQQECREQLNASDQALYRMGQEMDQIKQLVARIEADLAQKDKEQAEGKTELERVGAQLRECRENQGSDTDRFNEKESELKTIAAEVEKFREEVSEAQTGLRLLDEERRGLARELDRMETHATESRDRIQTISGEIGSAMEKRERCALRSQTLSEELEDLFEELRRLDESVKGAERERAAVQENRKVEEDRLEKSRFSLTELKERIHQSEMEQTEIRMRMDGLIETAGEKHGVRLQDQAADYLVADFSAEEVKAELERLKELRQNLGEVNLTAIQELEALEERYGFIQQQREDLLNSIETLHEAIRRTNKESLERFNHTFSAVDRKLKEIFPVLFGGGSAGLKLTSPSSPLESGVLVEVRPPGKKISHMGLLSGGEKALVAMAVLFSIYMIKPSPFCLLDEVDAPLDEANVDRFNRLLLQIREASQIIMVTHSRKTMEITDRLYGVTMESAGVSKAVSVDMQAMKKRLEAMDSAASGEHRLH